MKTTEVTVEPKDEQVESIENFIETLLRINLDGLPKDDAESLIYDINEVVVSLERIVSDYEQAKSEHDLAK